MLGPHNDPTDRPPAAASTVTGSLRRPRKKYSRYLTAPAASSAPSKKRKSKSRKSTSQRSQSSISVQKPQHQLPRVIGNTYVKVENINITNMLVMFPLTDYFFACKTHAFVYSFQRNKKFPLS